MRAEFARLPNSRAEADNLLSLRSEKNNLRAVDFDANRALFISGRLNSYRIIHIGTHAVAQQSRPELAKLVFSLVDRDGKPSNGYLFAYDISQLNLRAELITLAGCKTGLGEEIRGEGTVGLSHAFLQSGASAILVSLWDVDDESSAALMRLFYDALFCGDKCDPLAACCVRPRWPWPRKNDGKARTGRHGPSLEIGADGRLADDRSAAPVERLAEASRQRPHCCLRQVFGVVSRTCALLLKWNRCA